MVSMCAREKAANTSSTVASRVFCVRNCEKGPSVSPLIKKIIEIANSISMRVKPDSYFKFCAKGAGVLMALNTGHQCIHRSNHTNGENTHEDGNDHHEEWLNELGHILRCLIHLFFVKLGNLQQHT